MDDHIAKPLRISTLRQALIRWGRPGSARPPDDRDAPAPAAHGGPSFDRDLLAECCGGDSALIGEVLETFLRSTPASLAAVAAAVAANCASDLQREAHRLKGSCQTIGALELAAGCATLLTLARQGDLAAAQTTLTALRDDWEQTRQDLCNYLHVLGNG